MTTGTINNDSDWVSMLSLGFTYKFGGPTR